MAGLFFGTGHPRNTTNVIGEISFTFTLAAEFAVSEAYWSWNSDGEGLRGAIGCLVLSFTVT